MLVCVCVCICNGDRLRQQSKFPSFDTVNIPTVLVLGNHSSGKSTFINYMLGQEVQKTGKTDSACVRKPALGNACSGCPTH